MADEELKLKKWWWRLETAFWIVAGPTVVIGVAACAVFAMAYALRLAWRLGGGG